MAWSFRQGWHLAVTGSNRPQYLRDGHLTNRRTCPETRADDGLPTMPTAKALRLRRDSGVTQRAVAGESRVTGA